METRQRQRYYVTYFEIGRPGDYCDRIGVVVNRSKQKPVGIWVLYQRCDPTNVDFVPVRAHLSNLGHLYAGHGQDVSQFRLPAG